MRGLVMYLFLVSAASAVQADMSRVDREGLLEFYPCGAELSDDELAYLADWANAKHLDPCMLSAEEFAENFVWPE